MRIIVPFAAARPKTRLAPLLDDDERRGLAEAMLADVLAAIRAAGHAPEVLATEDVQVDAPVEIDDRPLTTAVNDVLASTDDPIGIVMADLALVTPEAIRKLCGADGDVVIAPGRGGGTNALVVRHSEFRVDYHGASYLDHLNQARDVSATVREIDSFRLAVDIDEEADLVELLLHGSGASRDWLESVGFTLDVTEGRVAVRRE